MTKYIRTNLPLLRFAHGRISQKTVSEATGIGQKTISALETGASKGIEFNTLLKLCVFFNCTPSELLVIEEELPSQPISNKSRKKAKDIVARGLSAALQAKKTTPEQVWAEFDAIQTKLQKSARQAATNR